LKEKREKKRKEKAKAKAGSGPVLDFPLRNSRNTITVRDRDSRMPAILLLAVSLDRHAVRSGSNKQRDKLGERRVSRLCSSQKSDS